MSALTRRALLTTAFAGIPVIALAGEGGEDKDKPKKEAEFISLGDFTVNVKGVGRRREYLVLTVSVETPVGTGGKLNDIVPRVQDAVLRRLMMMSDEGLLKPNQTDPLAIKDALYDTISKLKPESVKDVLITRILYS